MHLVILYQNLDICAFQPANNAKRVQFPAIPTKTGEFEIKVSAIVNVQSTPKYDIVSKMLHVEASMLSVCIFKR